MKNALVIGALGLVISTAMLAFGFYAGNMRSGVSPQVALAGPAPDQARIEQIVRDYLVANPELLTEMQASLEMRQKDEERAAQLATISTSEEEIFRSPYDGVMGNPQGNVTMVEFFDYNCGFCKRALGDVEAMVAADPELRFVMKDFPILGPDSQRAHVVAMAFRELFPEKHAEYHLALMKAPGRATEDSAMRLAISMGADEATMREAMKNPRIVQAFASTYELANRLSITGTPSYVVGDEVVFGALGRDVLSEKVDLARNGS